MFAKVDNQANHSLQRKCSNEMREDFKRKSDEGGEWKKIDMTSIVRRWLRQPHTWYGLHVRVSEPQQPCTGPERNNYVTMPGSSASATHVSVEHLQEHANRRTHSGHVHVGRVHRRRSLGACTPLGRHLRRKLDTLLPTITTNQFRQRFQFHLDIGADWLRGVRLPGRMSRQPFARTFDLVMCK